MRIDFHTHILPHTDDGSKSTEQSLKMLLELRNQGISTVIATPHFYSEFDSVDSFLTRREENLTEVKNKIKTDNIDTPDIICGAEVLFYNELYSLEGLEDLCIGKSKYILIEMPFFGWDKSMIDRLYKISANRGLKIILAHIDRYLSKNNMRFMDALLDMDVYFQLNADFFSKFMSRKTALNIIKKRGVYILGSDCHNMTSRKPDIAHAYDYVESKLGREYVRNFENFTKKILI